jgi:hypothetical protein
MRYSGLVDGIVEGRADAASEARKHLGDHTQARIGSLRGHVGGLQAEALEEREDVALAGNADRVHRDASSISRPTVSQVAGPRSTEVAAFASGP